MTAATAARRRSLAPVTDDSGKLAPIPTPIAARKGKIWPRAVDQTISEPSSIIGDVTGKKYATLSEHAPEALTISPLQGVKHYAAGGTVAVADPNADAYSQELANANRALASEQAVQVAAKDTQNKADVGMAQTLQNTEDKVYGEAGVAKPADVNVAAGGTTLSNSPLTRLGLQTNEQVATQQDAMDRSLSYAQSRANSAQAAVNRVQAASAAPTQQTVEAERAAGSAAGVAARAANQKAQSSAATAQEQLPPGQVRDPDTGEIITPAEARIRAAERGVEYDDVNKRFTTKADINSRTDNAGNVRRDDGTWVSKQGNELRNGVWTDPATGNTLIDRNTWQSPDGLKFHITNPNTGAGYWETPDGFVLGSDGVWTNHATGQEMIDGVIYSPQQLSAYRSTKSSTSAGYNLDDVAAADAGTTDYALP